MAHGSNSGRVMAALSHAAVIDVTAADQSRGRPAVEPWKSREDAMAAGRLLRVEVRHPFLGGLQ